jgi:hypothetical protein
VPESTQTADRGCSACTAGSTNCEAAACANTSAGLVSEVETADMMLHVGGYLRQLAPGSKAYSPLNHSTNIQSGSPIELEVPPWWSNLQGTYGYHRGVVWCDG